MEDSNPAEAGLSLTTDPFHLTFKVSECSGENVSFCQKTGPYAAAFDAILKQFGRYLRADPSAERWQSG